MKRITALTLSILMLVSLCGCSAGSAGAPAAPQQAPAAAEQAAENTAEDYSKVEYEIRLGSASTGSTNQVLQTGVAAVVSEHSALTVSAITTQGSSENVRLLQDKELELASINGDAAYMAWTGTGNFEAGELEGMSQLFSTFSNQAIFVTREGTGITKIEDLVGRKVSVDAAGSGAADLAYGVLYYGYDMWDDKIDIQYMSYTDEVEALKDGNIDAMVAHLNTGSPAAYFAELDVTCNDLVLLEVSDEAMEKIQEAQPFQKKAELTKENCTLSCIGDQEITAMENYAVVYARNDIPEDVVYAFVRTLMEHAEEVDSYHKQGASIRPEYAMRGLLNQIPVHPGAAAYYKEIGIWNDNFHTVDE